MMNRRSFLRGAGALGLSALGARHLPAAFADDTAPKRLLMICHGHGTVYDGWAMRPGSRPDDRVWTEDLWGLSQGQFSRALAPLHGVRDRLNVIDGLSMVSAERDIPGYRHEKGWVHAFTGGDVLLTGDDIFATQPSLDQLVAEQIALADRLPSLELAIAEARPVCHAGYAQQLPLERDPARAYDRLFGLSSSTDPLIAAQGSVLQFAAAEYEQLAPKLSAAERERLGTHFDLLRQLEQRIEGLRTASCGYGLDPSGLAGSFAGYDALFRSMGELVAAAFSCDMTRVATLSLGDLPSDAFGWGHYLSGDAHNDFAHRIYVDPEAALAMTDYHRVHAEQIAWLVGLLESIPDVDGGSVMDNTLIVWASEMADGWHGYERFFAATIGGEWALRTGQYLHYPYETSSPFELLLPTGPSFGAGVPHQHLLVTAAQAMGLDINEVGTAELSNKAGERVSLAGGLPELLR